MLRSCDLVTMPCSGGLQPSSGLVVVLVVVSVLTVAMWLQVIHKHFYLKRTDIMCQCEEWIADIQQYSSDKRVGRTMSHHAAALKVSCPFCSRGGGVRLHS